jgi:hypothetical protein
MSRELNLRLRVYRGDTGSSMLLEDLSPRHTVQNLKEVLEHVINLSVADQILLCENGTQLDNNQPLELYGLGVVALVMFLCSSRYRFNSKRFSTLIAPRNLLKHYRRIVGYLCLIDAS